MTRKVRSLSMLALLSVLAPGIAFAQSDSDKATAREIGQSAEVKLAAQDYKGAEAEFRRANALFHAPTLILGLARAQAGQGKVVEAWESYHSIILENVTTTPSFANALADAQKEIVKVEARRGRVTITVTGADSPKVTLDDAPQKAEALGVARFVNPGAHVVKASADGYRPATQSITIAEGGTQTVALVLEKDSGAPGVVAVVPGGATPDSSQPTTPGEPTAGGSTPWNLTAGYVVGGVGAAFLIEGLVTGVIAIGKHSDLAKVCTNGCPSSDSSELSSYHTVGALSTVGFVVGAVGLAGGAVLILTAPKHPSSAPATGLQLTPYVGFGSAGATGTF
jgi:hypothetical protein